MPANFPEVCSALRDILRRRGGRLVVTEDTAICYRLGLFRNVPVNFDWPKPLLDPSIGIPRWGKPFQIAPKVPQLRWKSSSDSELNEQGGEL